MEVPDGYERTMIEKDGNCLFRAIANHVYGDPEEHAKVRKIIVDKMEETNEWEVYGGLTLERPLDEKNMKNEFFQELKRYKKEGTWNTLSQDKRDEVLAEYRWGYFLDDMSKDRKWGSEFCIPYARDLWRLTINLYDSKNKRWQYYNCDEAESEFFIEHTGNHYNVLKKKSKD